MTESKPVNPFHELINAIHDANRALDNVLHWAYALDYKPEKLPEVPTRVL